MDKAENRLQINCEWQRWGLQLITKSESSGYEQRITFWKILEQHFYPYLTKAVYGCTSDYHQI